MKSQFIAFAFFAAAAVSSVRNVASAEELLLPVNPEIRDYVSQVDQTSLFEYQAWLGHQSRCQSAEIRAIETRIDHFDPNSPTFTYFYKRIEGNPALPAIIFLPGGPGGFASVMNTPQLAGLTVIAIDPRGTGCNFYPHTLPDSTITTLQTARDIVDLVRQLGITEYVIYGTSYGTILGTVLVAELEKESTLARPHALVIEGTLGKQIETFNNYYQSWIDLWEQYLAANPAIRAALTELTSQVEKSSSAWGAFIADAFALDFRPLDAKLQLLVRHQQGLLDVNEWNQLLAWFNEKIEEPDEFQPWTLTFAGSKRVENLIACKEISSPWQSRSFHLDGSNLVPRPVEGIVDLDTCLGQPIGNPYDAKDYQVRAPIYYLQGTLDPQTTFSSARYHFNSQQHSEKKVFLSIKDAGHRPSRLSTQLGRCMPSIWERIFALHDFDGVVDVEGRCLRVYK